MSKLSGVLFLLFLATRAHAVAGPSVQVLTGPFSPASMTAAAGANVTFLQFTVSNTSAEAILLNGLNLAASGSAADQFTNAVLYDDVNADGIPDTFLGSQPFGADDGSLVFNFATYTLVPGDSKTFVLQGNTGSTLGTLVRIVTSLNGIGQSTSQPISSPNLPFSSSTVTVVPPQLQVISGPFNPVAVTRSAGTQTQFMQFTVSNTGGEGINLNGFSFKASGSAQDQYTDLQLYNDIGADGVPDSFLQSAPFSVDDGSLSLSFSTIILNPGDSRTFIVQGNSGVTVGTLVRGLLSANGSGQFSGLPIATPNLPFNSSTMTVVPPQLQVTAGPFNPAAVTRSAGTQTTFMQFTVSNTGGEGINLNGFTFQASGSAQDQYTDLQLYNDIGADGVPDGFIQGVPFSVDDGSLNLSFSTIILNPGDSRTFIVQGNSGVTVGTLVRSLQSANGSGQFSGLPIASASLPLTSNAVTVVPPQLQVTAGAFNPASVTRSAGTQTTFMQFTVSNTGGEGINLNGFTFQASGSAQDQYTDLQLYNDIGADGVPDGFIQGVPFSVDDGSLNLSFSTIILNPGDSRTFIVQGNSGVTVGTLVRSLQSANGSGQFSGLPIASASLPLTSNAVTVVPPQLQVTAGAFNPASVTRSAGTQTTFMQFTVSNTGGEGINLNGFTFQASGSAQDQYTDLQLYNDIGADGVPDGFIQGVPFSVDDGSLNLSFSTIILNPGDSRTFIVQGNSGVTVGTLVRSLQSANGSGQFSGLPIASASLPLTSNAVTVVPPQLQVTAGPFNPASVTRSAGAQTTFMQFTVSNTGGEGINLNGFSFQASGSAQDQYTDLQLYNDIGADGVPDSFLQSAPFSVDDGSLSLSFSTITLNPGDSRTFIVQGNSGVTVGTLVRSLQSAIGSGQFSGLPIASANLPFLSNTMTVVGPTLQAQAGPANPAAASASAGALGVPVLQWRLTNPSTNEAVTLTGFKIQGSGSANEALLSSYRVVADNNSNGIEDGGDSSLGASNFAVNDGLSSVFTSAVNIPPGGQQDFLLLYDTGSAVGTHLPSLGDIIGTGFVSGAPAVMNGSAQANTLTVLNATPTISPSPSRSPTPTATPSISPSPTSTPVVVCALAGANTNLASSGGNADTLIAQQVNIPVNALVSAFEVYIKAGSSGSYRLGLYSDAAGAPSALLLDSGDLTNYGPGVVIAPVSPTFVSAGNYWVVFNRSGNVDFASGGSVFAGSLGSQPYGAMPSVFPGPSSLGNVLFSFGVDWCQSFLTPTFTPSLTPSSTPSPTLSSTPVITFSSTPTPSSSQTPFVSPTFTSSQTPLPSPTFTLTVTPFVPSATFTNSQTPFVPSATFTDSQTPVVPSATFTRTVTPSVPSPTFTSSRTPVPSATPTDSPVLPSATDTPTQVVVGTATFTSTVSGTPQPTGTAVVPAVLDQNVFRPGRGKPLGISLRALEDGKAVVRIFNIAGERIITPFEADVQAGLWYQANWDGKNEQGEPVGSGIYIVSVRGAGIRSLRKVVVLK